MTRCVRGWVHALGALALLACSERGVELGDESGVYEDHRDWPDPLAGLARGDAQRERVCARAADDPVHDTFCLGAGVAPRSLIELQTALGVDAGSHNGFSQANQGKVVGIAVAGHSTGLGTRTISALNPRVITSRVELMKRELTAVAYTRGEQFVELVSRDRSDNTLHFYLVGFRQACNAAAEGCSHDALLTPTVERDWLETSLYDEHDVANTVLDCAPCHQPGGPGSKKMLRMQELDAPWTHWFWRNSEGGRALLADYVAAKGDEELAGLSAEHIQNAEPEMLSTLVILTDFTQPNEFDSGRIEMEVQESAAKLGGMQPVDNRIPGQSPTWRAIFEHAQRGDVIGVPYHDVKVTDPGKLARATEAYQAYRRGELDRAELPDLRDVYPDDPQLLAELGFAPEPSLDGRATLRSACSPCHSARLDPTLSRARFRADLEGMSRAEKDTAVARLMLPPEHPLAMPPARLRVLPPESRRRAIEALRE